MLDSFKSQLLKGHLKTFTDADSSELLLLLLAVVHCGDVHCTVCIVRTAIAISQYFAMSIWQMRLALPLTRRNRSSDKAVSKFSNCRCCDAVNISFVIGRIDSDWPNGSLSMTNAAAAG